MDTRSFIIPASNKSMVEEHIEKLNKRTRKLSLPEIALAWGKAFLQKCTIKGSQLDVLVIPVEVSGPLSVNYDGWQFIATLQHLPTGENVIRSISDQFEVPARYQNCGSNCEHCKVNRYRKDTYLVRHDDSRVMQVGSSCIKDFLGGDSPDDLIKKATLAAELVQFMNGASHGGTGSNDEGVFHIETFLAQTAACIRDHGWLSKSEAKMQDKKPTADWVYDNLEGINFSVINDAEKEKAKKAVEWVESLSDEECEASDYLHNIRAIARSGMVGLRTMGYAASIIPAYDRDMAKRKPKPISNHVGVIKMREEFDLTLKNIFSGTSTYGEFIKYIFRDDSGNMFVWITSTSSQNLEVGQKYRIRGTVKEHSKFKETKQTVISHCKIVTYYDKSF